MAPEIRVHFLPELTSPAELAGGAVVVIDVLRATTVIPQALASGCRGVIPCGEIEEARQTAARFPPQDVVLGGERGGLPIDGFHLGNSPGDYGPAAVRDKTLVFTTTNGTHAMLACRQAQRVVTAAFVNLSAVCRALAAAERVDLLCAGTARQITREDVLLAGAMTGRLLREGDFQAANDQALLALAAWQEAERQPLSQALRQTQGGRNLQRLGLERDIDFSAQTDLLDLVPELDIPAWTIRANG